MTGKLVIGKFLLKNHLLKIYLWKVCLWKLICGTLVYGKLICGKFVCGKLVCEKLLERYFIVINTEEKRPVECSLGRTEPYSLLEEGSLERGIYVKIAPWE